MLDGRVCSTLLGPPDHSATVDAQCSCASIVLQDPTVTTGFNTSISLSSYDLYKNAPDTKPTDEIAVGAALVSRLDSYLDDLSDGTLLANIQSAQRSDPTLPFAYPSWAQATRARQDASSSSSARVVLVSRRVEAPASAAATSSARDSISTAIIILLAAAGVIMILLIGVIYKLLNKKQKTQVVVMDQDGNIVSKIEQEIDSMDDAMLKRMFQEYKKKQMMELQQKQDQELQIAKDQLAIDIPDLQNSSPDAQTDGESLVAKILAIGTEGTVAVPASVQDSMKTDDLLTLARRQEVAAAELHDAEKASLREKVASRREKLEDKQTKELEAAGVERERIMTIMKERSTLEAEAGSELAEINTSFSAQETAMKSNLEAALKDNLTKTTDLDERSALQVRGMQYSVMNSENATSCFPQRNLQLHLCS
eukprot:SAG31_NODE_8922_length_1363_cov_0.991297_1_plen_423_part_01